MHSPSPLFSSHHLTPQVVFLEKRVSELEKDTAANGEQHRRLRQENLQLVHR